MILLMILQLREGNVWCQGPWQLMFAHVGIFIVKSNFLFLYRIVNVKQLQDGPEDISLGRDKVRVPRAQHSNFLVQIQNRIYCSGHILVLPHTSKASNVHYLKFTVRGLLPGKEVQIMHMPSNLTLFLQNLQETFSSQSIFRMDSRVFSRLGSAYECPQLLVYIQSRTLQDLKKRDL